MTPEAREALAALLAAARRDGRQVAALPPELTPPDADTAYAVADRVAALLGWAPLGWKVAGTSDVMRARLRMPEPILGRSFARFLVESPARLRHAELLDPIVEAEVMFRLGGDLPPRPGRPWTREEVAASVAAVHAGIEVAECRFPATALPPFPAVLADGSGSGRYVLGPALPPGTELGALPVTVEVDGVPRCRGGGAEVMGGDPLLSVVWLANRRNALGDGLRAGEWVSSGTCTGMLAAQPGTRVVARFGADTTAEIAFEA
jgi:2-keto-4-pentenoate hydratase